MLCPVRALKLYVDHLLVCFGVGRRGLATSKQSISHWVRDTILLAYEARNLPSPLSLRAHSTRGVASSQALFRGVPLEDICVAAGWSSPHTFVRFYNLDIDTAPGSQILSVWTGRILVVHYWTRWAAFLAWRVWYIVPKAWKAHAALSEPMIENVSGYSRNPCSLNREWDTAFAAKLLTLPTEFFSAEKSEEWMARSPV